ncbi:DUF4139 domain-containing protein [Kitasatospora arboriphila]
MVVYASGALCRRRARGRVPADGRVRLTGLPRVADAGSLRASVLSGGARVTAARLEPEAKVRSRSDLPGLRLRVDRARDAAEALRQRSARQEARIAEVSAVRAVPPPLQADEPHRRTPTDAWFELADFVDERLAALHARSADLAEELRLAEHELALAEDALARASSAVAVGPVTLGGSAVVTLEGAAEGAEVELEVEYGVPGAVWVPTYRLTYRQGEGSGTLLLRAQLAQRTGEDWSGVRIGLSTADLQRRTDLPQLRSLRIGRRQAVPSRVGLAGAPGGAGRSVQRVRRGGPPAAAACGAGPSGGRWPSGPGGPARCRAGRDAGGRPHRRGDRAAVRGASAASAARSRCRAAGLPDAGAVRSGVRRGAAAAGGDASAGAGGVRPRHAREGRGRGTLRTGRRLRRGAGAGGAAGAAGSFAGAAGLRGPGAGRPGPAGAPARPAVPRGGARPGGDGVAEPRRVGGGAGPAAHAVRPRVSAGSFDQRYDAAARADVPSDGTWHTVTVGEVPVSLRTEYVCVRPSRRRCTAPWC